MKSTLYLCICVFWTTLVADSEDGLEMHKPDFDDYVEPMVKPKILHIDQAPTTNSPVQIKRYYRRKKLNEKRKFFVSKSLNSTLPLVPGYTEYNQEAQTNNFGTDTEIYFCKRSPGKRTSESRLCQINKTPKCQCVRSECKYFRTYAHKEIYRCVREENDREWEAIPPNIRAMDVLLLNRSSIDVIDDIRCASNVFLKMLPMLSDKQTFLKFDSFIKICILLRVSTLTRENTFYTHFD